MLAAGMALETPEERQRSLNVVFNTFRYDFEALLGKAQGPATPV